MISSVLFDALLPPLKLSVYLIGLGLAVSYYILSSIQSWYRLRDFPTPAFSAAFSYFWLAKTTWSGRQFWIQRELHKKYGPLVRVGPNEILTDDPDILKKISSARSSYKRGAWYQTGRFNPFRDNLLSILEPAEHAKAKARTVPAYSGREMEEGVEPGINEQIHTLIGVLGQKYTPSFKQDNPPLLDLAPISAYFTLDVITRLAFGKEFGYLRDETDHYNFLGSLRILWPVMSTSSGLPWIRNILTSKLFLILFGPKTTDKSGFGALMRPAEEQVKQRFATETKQETDMLSSLMRRGFTQEECEAEGLLMIVGGGESTASAIRSTMIHIMTTPSAYQKLKQEIQLAICEGRVSYPIKYEEAKQLPYLQATIYEGIRMRPPILGLLPKVVPEGGDTFHGKFFPAGTLICANVSSLLCSTAIFGADADVFSPERFLDEVRGSERRRTAELAFGSGQWMCVGKTLALMELHKLVFELLRVYDFQLASPLTPCNIKSYGVFLEENMLVKVTNSVD